MEDLNMALVLCEGHGKAACQAYTQRALVKRLQGKAISSIALYIYFYFSALSSNLRATWRQL